MRLDSIETVYATHLGDLRSTEKQLIEALPKLAEAASDKKLKEVFIRHLAETRIHLVRIEVVVATSPSPVGSERCEGSYGLIQTAERVIAADGSDAVRDVALIAAAQRIEHFEIAAYGAARALAGQLDQREAQELLREILDEETRANALLGKLATGGFVIAGINERAHT